MSYSRYFGMRSFENVVRDARFRVPRDGTPLKIGSPVVLDDAAPGSLKQAGAAAAPGANAGLLIFEHIQNKSDALTTTFDPPYDAAPPGQYAQVMRGPGVKVWFMNVKAKVMYDGRLSSEGGLLDDGLTVADLKPGDGLVPAAGGKFDIGGATDKAWLIVEQANPSTGRVEARLTF